jgi:Holliday junction DNA helicase RuvB
MIIDILTALPFIKYILQGPEPKSIQTPVIAIPQAAIFPTFTFRPQKFDEYIGQERNKTILSQYIKIMKARNYIFPHVLIHGKAGMGKTTLARIVAKEMGVPMTEAMSSIFANESVSDITDRLQSGFLFIDEIHALPRDIAEQLYPCMEDFKCNGAKIQPFTLVGCTTELGELLKNRKPFIDRFKLIIELQDYTLEELTAIAKQYRQVVFPNDSIPDSIYLALATNCRATPRLLIRLLEATVYFSGDYQTVLKNFGILKDGYTIKDLKLLGYISKTKGVGAQNIASYLDISATNYLYEIEPYLLKTDMLIRTGKGRTITEAGIVLLNTLI